MKHVLFIAPCEEYARTTIRNLVKSMRKNSIVYDCCTDPGNLYFHTPEVNISFVYCDPLKYHTDMLYGIDVVYGKKELVRHFRQNFLRCNIPVDNRYLNRYIIENNINPAAAPPSNHPVAYLPEITNVYFNDPVTVVLWSDGTKTTVRCQDGDVYSKEVGLSLCVTKKALGNMPNFNNIFRKWCPEEKTEPVGSTTTIVDTGGQSNITDVTTRLREALKKSLGGLLEDL